MNALLAIDQGTSSTRAVLYSADGRQLAYAQQEFTQYYPQDGWVEHDANEIWQTTLAVLEQVLKTEQAKSYKIMACGITNQRETTVIWNKVSGEPVHRAIVWQDRRTHQYCLQLQEHAKQVQYKTGLLLDPYFSATKLQWLLQYIPKAKELAEANQLAFGTIDSYLIWKLTQGAVHATDATNASRTMLYNIRGQCWDQQLLELFDIPPQILPQVLDCNAHFGYIYPQYVAQLQIPITGVVGDQQAAAIGQACFEDGMLKATYGTGGFLLLNTGDELITSNSRLLSTISSRINKQTTYGLEGSIFNAGTTIKWLRDDLKIIEHANQTEELASSLHTNGGVYLVPAFTGLGAPYWDPAARAAILGMQRDTSRAHFARAALEAVCYQTQDVLTCMIADYAKPIKKLRVDGGMVVNNWLLQFLADITQVMIQRPQVYETTSWGAALMAGLGVGLFSSLSEAAKTWQCNREVKPQIELATRDTLYANWKRAVARVRS